MVIENKQAGRRHGGSQFVFGLPIGFFSSFARWRYGLHDALQTKCTQIVYCVFLQLKVKGALAAEMGKWACGRADRKDRLAGAPICALVVRPKQMNRRQVDSLLENRMQDDEQGG